MEAGLDSDPRKDLVFVVKRDRVRALVLLARSRRLMRNLGPDVLGNEVVVDLSSSHFNLEVHVEIGRR
jgi:hypothetical protein